MRRKLFDVSVVLVLGIIGADSNDLIIFFSLKEHKEITKNKMEKDDKVQFVTWLLKNIYKKRYLVNHGH